MGRSLRDVPPDEPGIPWALWEKQRWRECKLIAPAVFERWAKEAVKTIKEDKSKKAKTKKQFVSKEDFLPNEMD